MTEKPKQTSISRRFPLIFALGIVICFVIFPLFLINLGLNQFVQKKHENHNNRLQKKINSILNTIERFSDNQKFAHYVLSELNGKVKSSKSPAKTFARLKTQLQNKYPDCFTFVFYDKEGQINSKISDDTSYRYILQKTWAMLHKASLLFDPANQQNNTKVSLAEIESDLKILRNFLGKLLVSHQLELPWLREKLGTPLQTSPAGDRTHLWYRTNKNFTFFCFISDSFIKGTAGADYALQRAKSSLPEFSANISTFPASQDFYPPVTDSITRARLILALSRYENLDFSKVYFEKNFIIGCQRISQTQRAVCYCPASQGFSPAQEKKRLIFMALKFSLIFAFILFVWSKTTSTSFVSIRYKLTVLFAYAILTPALILGSIGLEYLEHKREQLIFNAQTNSINFMRNLDEYFQVYLTGKSEAFRKYIRQKNLSFKQSNAEEYDFAEISRNFARDLEPDSVLIFDLRGKLISSRQPRGFFHDLVVPGQLAKTLFEELEANVNKDIDSQQSKQAQFSSLFELARRREIIFIGIGAQHNYRYYDFLGEPQSYECQAMLQAYWGLEKLQATFLQQQIEQTQAKNHSSTIVAAYLPNKDELLHLPGSENNQIKDLGVQAMEKQIVRLPKLTLAGKTYTATAMKGVNLDQVALIVLKPLNVVESVISDLKIRMFFLGLLILAAGFTVFRAMTRLFLQPVEEIKAALHAIEKRNFDFRLTGLAGNEFGLLADSFNHTLENFKEIETARIVQENLLPNSSYKQKNIQLLASCEPFSRIGGDYFDYFSPQQNILIVFIGDVSGHGIAAALVMAMAKATISCERGNFSNIANLMSRLDNLLSDGRKHGSKEYMTGIIAAIDCNSGEVEIINSGHCMPALVANNSEEPSVITSGGLPLGFNPKSRQQHSFKIKEYLVLYSDGLAEATDKEGNFLGHAGFLQMAQQNFNQDPAVFMSSLLSAHKSWAARQQDDQTIILIRFSK